MTLTYLTALTHKPRAVTNATVVRELPPSFQQLRKRMEQAHSTGYKDFLQVLLLTRDYLLEDIRHAIEAVGQHQADASSLKQYLDTKARSQSPPLDFLTPSRKPLITEADTQCYDRLLREVGQ